MLPSEGLAPPQTTRTSGVILAKTRLGASSEAASSANISIPRASPAKRPSFVLAPRDSQHPTAPSMSPERDFAPDAPARAQYHNVLVLNPCHWPLSSESRFERLS